MSIMPFFNTRRRSSYDPFPRDTWDPFSEYHSESVIAAPHPHPHPHAPSHPHHANGSLANARVEWTEAPDAYFIKTELPGIRREDVKVVLEDDKLLKISGQRDMEFEDRHDNWHHVERSRGKFLTAFMLPEDARADQVRSSMENGMLTITVPKRQAKHHVRPIEIVV